MLGVFEVTEENQAIVDGCDYYGDNMAKCEKCAAEHRQLAEWLRDYKRMLSGGGVVKIGGKVYKAEKPMLKCITKDGEHYFSGFYEVE